VRLDRERKRERVSRLGARLRAALQARARFDRQQHARLVQGQARLRRALAAAIAQRRARVGAAAQLLGAVGYRNVLKRGFALVRDSRGAPLRSAAAVGAGQSLRIEFADGERGATADGALPPGPEKAPKSAAPRAPRPAKRGAAGGQGSLF
jgi:exodeoxyribonuclease VII large subunit